MVTLQDMSEEHENPLEENRPQEALLASTRDNQTALRACHEELNRLVEAANLSEAPDNEEKIKKKALEFCRLYFQMERENELTDESRRWMANFRGIENDFFRDQRDSFTEAYEQAKRDVQQAHVAKKPKPEEPKKKEEVKIDNNTQLGFSMSKKGQSPSLEVRGNIAVFQEQLEKYCKENNIPLKVEVDKETKKKTFIVNLPPDQMAKMIEAVQTKCDQTLKTKFPNDSTAGVHPQRRFEPTKHASRWQSAASAPRSQAPLQQQATPQPPAPAVAAAPSNAPRRP